MILDELTELADAQSVVGTAGTAILTDVIDLNAAQLSPTLRDEGDGTPIFLVIQVDTTILASGGAANVTFALTSDSTADLATSPTTHYSSGAIPKATLVAGYQIVTALPRGKTYERYLGLKVTPDTNNTTAGKINAFLTLNPATINTYDDAV